MVHKAHQWGPIRYFRNDKNVGIKNFELCVERAAGEFVWLVGDDDMIIQNKISKICEILKSNSDLDYFYVNHSLEPIEKRDYLIRERESSYNPELSKCHCRDLSQRRLTLWDDLLSLDCRYPETTFTSIVCHIFRRSIWLENRHLLNIDLSQGMASFDNIFPHIRILAERMVGRPAYYIGDPCVLMGQGSQDWHGSWRTIMLLHLPTAIDLYERLGVSQEKIRHLRQSFLVDTAGSFLWLLLSTDVPGREYFSARKFLWSNRRHLIFLLAGILKTTQAKAYGLMRHIMRNYKVRY